MRRISALILIIALLLCLCACGAENKSFELSPNLADAAAMANMLRNARSSATCFIAEHIEYDSDGVTISWKDNGADSFTLTRTDRAGKSVPIKTDGYSARDKLTGLDGAYTYSLTGYSESGDIIGSDSQTVYFGFVVENGRLRYYSHGEPVRDTDIGTLHFDSAGYYTSGDRELDDIITALIAENTTPKMTRLRMFHVMYNYIMDNYEYISLRFADAESGWEIDFAKEFLTSSGGNCFSYAGATAMIARALGFEAKGIYGEVNQTFEWCDHGWTEVYYNGKTYVCDSEMEGVFSRARDLGWDLFMKEYGDTVTEYNKWEW